MIILNQNEIESKIKSGELSKDFYIHTAELKNRLKNTMKAYRWLVLKNEGEALYLFAKSKLALIRKLQKIDKNVGELIENAESIRAIEKIEEDFQILENRIETIKSQEKSSKLDDVLMNIVLILFFLSFSRLVITSTDKLSNIFFIACCLAIFIKEGINLFRKMRK